MGLSENSDDHIFKRHHELCNNLNMDSVTTTQAWESYESIRQHYTLEGDALHWLGCAIYVACRKSSTPTVGQTGSVVKGNCVSLTRLLRLCNFSLTQFFAKSKKWADMANMPIDFRKRVDRLERNFAVCCVAFKKYHVIFNEIFLSPVEDQPRQHRSRKQRNVPCTPARIFEFCWTLFVCIKGEFAKCSDDLVTSFHLLLACCDMAFSNALMSDRRDLLNPNFVGMISNSQGTKSHAANSKSNLMQRLDLLFAACLPSNWSSTDYIKPELAPCIIDSLCQHFDGIVLEAKWVKEYSWKAAITKLFEKDILQGNRIDFSGIFEAANFDNNLKAVNKVYEEHVLNVGEFDEKIFLAEYRRTQLINKQAAGDVRSAYRTLNSDGDLNATIGSPKGPTDTEKSQSKRNFGNQYEDQIQQLFPSTPLTGRKYLRGNKDSQRNAPLTTATQCVIRLQTLLTNRQPEPSAELKEIFRCCVRDPTDAIKSRVQELGDKFRTQYTQQTADQPNGNIDLANKRLTLSETLYYKLLENIVEEERLRNPNLDVTVLLEQDVFHRCMFACSIEIVIYSYNCQRKFPWILQALDLKAYYFYRVIELIVRTKDQLSRDVVKHLNSIEEQILESIAWESDSPLWQCIIESNRPVPSCEDTSIPGQQLEDGVQVVPNTARKIQIPTTTTSTTTTPVTCALQSPITPATERFQSPITNSVAKKKLFVDPQSSKITPGKSILQNSTSKAIALMLVDEKGNKKLIPLSEFNGEALIATNSTAPTTPTPTKTMEPPAKPRRNGSLALFFRKFYNLAGVRLGELCTQLNITDLGLQQRVFTCFEYCIIENIDLMKDRHLDQILMCAVYIMCRVSKNEKSFTDIMRCYRLQPQAYSHVYRSVLMRKTDTKQATTAEKTPTSNSEERSSSIKRNPGEVSGTSTVHDQEIRGDLIKFYNTVFVRTTQSFAMKYANPQDVIIRFIITLQSDPEWLKMENLHLSPLPASKHFIPSSPKRRVIENVFVRPYDQLASPTQVKQFCYYFSRSPSKDLKNINNVISSRVGKRLLTDEAEETDVSPIKKQAPAMTRKLQGLIEERLGQTKE